MEEENLRMQLLHLELIILFKFNFINNMYLRFSIRAVR